MKAITVFKPYDARMAVVPDPIPKDNEVVIKVKETGVCATDIGIYTGKSSFVESGEITYPVRFGHEFSGVVTAVGKRLKTLRSATGCTPITALLAEFASIACAAIMKIART